MEPEESWGLVILATQFTLNQQIENSAPNALKSIVNIPLIDYWLSCIKSSHKIKKNNMCVITNSKYYQQFLTWASLRFIPTANIIDAGDENSHNLSFDIVRCVNSFVNCNKLSGLLMTTDDKIFRFNEFQIDRFLSNGNNNPIIYYSKDTNDMLKSNTDDVFLMTGITPLFYVFPSSAVTSILEFDISATKKCNENFIPYSLFKYFHNINTIISKEEFQYQSYDVNIPEEYKAVCNYYKNLLDDKLSFLPSGKFCEKSCARVGFMGNPSDGFNGKTISFLINNFYAQVFFEDNLSSTCQIEFVPHSDNDPMKFSNFSLLQEHMQITGYYGGLRLLQATCKVFSEKCFENSIFIHLQRGFRISYETTIPRMVGMSGSSALVVATFRGLMKYYGVTLDDLNIKKEDFPLLILNIEKIELNISAGLQDRVIQTYGGLVHMDFTGEKNIYTEVDVNLLPCLYLVYNTNAGGDSGQVHSTVKDRWQLKDPELVAGMQQLGMYADETKACLESRNYKQIAELINLNFATRRKLYGDAVVGLANIRIAEEGQAHGLALKFTGSGGAFIGLRSDGLNQWYVDIFLFL